MDRREFLKAGAVLSAGNACGYAVPLLTASELNAADGTGGTKGSSTKPKWGMVIDVGKCVPGCNRCMAACKNENNLAVYGNQKWDIRWIRKVNVKRTHPAGSKEKSLPLLCNHCEHPPCVLVCPVKASYKRDDGIVIVDYHRCIGCRYCLIACPYNARYFNYKENDNWPNKDYPKRMHGVSESCTFCAHLVDKATAKGEKPVPACVAACKEKALVFGNLNDPDSEISALIASGAARGLREDLGTEPKVYYIGL